MRRLALTCAAVLLAAASLAAQGASPPPAPRAYHLSPEERAKAISFSRAKYTLHFVEAAWTLLVLYGILQLGFVARTRDIAESASRKWYVQALIFPPLLTLLTDVPMLPTSVYLQHLELKYAQSVQSWTSWLWDWTKGEIISVVLGTLFAALWFGMVRWSPKHWWLWAWAASLPLIVFGIFITPVLIDPMFNDFTPLAAKHPDLVREIQKVTARGGLDIPPDRMFEMKASDKVTSLNAYVTGVGATKRVVVWDTTIARCTTPDILFTFGHEQGHYVLNHIPKTIVFLAVLLFVTLYLGSRGMDILIARRGAQWGIRGPQDWAAFPVLLLLITFFSFIAEPVTNAWSRMQEHQADVYGLEVIHGLVPHSQTVAADSFQLLGEVALADPDPPPLIEAWLYSHPSIGERVKFAESYDPWSAGKPTEFVK